MKEILEEGLFVFVRTRYDNKSTVLCLCFDYWVLLGDNRLDLHSCDEFINSAEGTGGNWW